MRILQPQNSETRHFLDYVSGPRLVAVTLLILIVIAGDGPAPWWIYVIHAALLVGIIRHALHNMKNQQGLGDNKARGGSA